MTVLSLEPAYKYMSVRVLKLKNTNRNSILILLLLLYYHYYFKAAVNSSRIVCTIWIPPDPGLRMIDLSVYRN